MREKRVVANECAYVIGIVVLAIGTALMERANFGMSMVVAPAYLMHLKLSQLWPWFSFGTAEYVLQAVLLLAAALIWRRFKPMYLLSFVTAVIYGFVLDGMLALIGLIPGSSIAGRVICYLLGLLLCSYGVSMLFHTYFAPEAYELLVKEISARFGTDIHKTKTVYDCVSCAAAVVMSFAFFGFGHFEGVKLGTVFCALVNGWLIGRCTAFSERYFEFRDGRNWRQLFE